MMGHPPSLDPPTGDPARIYATRPSVVSNRPLHSDRPSLRCRFSQSGPTRDIQWFVGLILFGLVFTLADTSVRAEENWLLDEKTDFEQFLSNLKSKEVLAHGVLDQARRAEAKAIQLEDQEAVGIARQAVELSQQALSEAQKRVALQQAKVVALDKAMRLGPGITGVTVEARGTVLKLQAGKWVPLQSAGPLQPGEAIKTGSNGRAEVLFRDGTRVELAPYSVFTIGWNWPLGNSDRNLRSSKDKGIHSCES